MRSLSPVSIPITGGPVAGTILHTDHCEVWQGGDADFVHDTWSGGLTGCALEGAPPNAKVACAPVAR